MAAHCRFPVGEVAQEESSDVIWVACVIDEVQDANAAARVVGEGEKEEILRAIRKEKGAAEEEGVNPQATVPPHLEEGDPRRAQAEVSLEVRGS